MKIKKVKNKQTFKFEEVEIRQPTVADAITAQKVSGAAEGIPFLAAVMAECCTFDGQKAVYEQIQQMETPDFLALSKEVDLDGVPAQTES